MEKVVFGRGFQSPTVTSYLQQRIFPALEPALADVRCKQLMIYLQETEELEKWRERKEDEYRKMKKEEMRKKMEAEGKDEDGEESWTGSEMQSEVEEEEVKKPVFDPIHYLALKLKEKLESSP